MKKKAVKHDHLCPFFWQVDSELLQHIAECVTNIENKTNLTPLSVFRLSDARACVRRSFSILNLTQAVRTDLYAKMEILA